MCHTIISLVALCFSSFISFCHFSHSNSFKSEFLQLFCFFLHILGLNERVISLYLLDLRHCVWRCHLDTHKSIFSYEFLCCAGALGQCEILRFVDHLSCAKPKNSKKRVAEKSANEGMLLWLGIVLLRLESEVCSQQWKIAKFRNR